MVVVYILTSIVGALITLVALSSYGWLLALLCAPVGGSALTLIVISVDLLRFLSRLAEWGGAKAAALRPPGTSPVAEKGAESSRANDLTEVDEYSNSAERVDQHFHARLEQRMFRRIRIQLR